MSKYLILAAGVLLIAGAVAYGVRDTLPKTLYETVIVEREVIEQAEPDTVYSFRDRIVRVEVEPTQVADAPEGAVDDVAAFCAEMIATATADTVGDPPAPKFLARSERRDGDRLLITGPMSDGTLRQFTLDGMRGDWQWRTSGDGIHAESDRWWWVGDCAGDLALGGGAGAGGGAIGGNVQSGALIGGGLGAARCLARFFN